MTLEDTGRGFADFWGFGRYGREISEVGSRIEDSRLTVNFSKK